MKLRSLAALPVVLALGLAASPALTQPNPAAHQHGHAQLQIAIDREQLELLLVSPAYNLTGFEHRPQTPEQQQAVEAIRDWLEQTAVVNTLDSLCTPVASHLNVGWDQKPEAEPEHDHRHDGTADHDSGHSDLEITQSLHCPGLSDTAQFKTNLMERFPALEQLEVQWAGPKGQGSARLGPENTSFHPGR